MRPPDQCLAHPRALLRILRSVLRAAPLAALLATPGFAQQTTDAISPEAATPSPAQDQTEPAQTANPQSPAVIAALAAKENGTPVTATTWMISAANPLAAQAGADILRKGGSAADAMIAAQAMLGLVEPQSSGLGGGAFLIWYDAASGTLTTLDGRETAPLAATPRLFQTPDGEPLGFFDAVVGGLSVGTPGTPALLEEAHRCWGTTPWPTLFTAAIDTADQGFVVSPRLAALVGNDAERLAVHPETAAYFLPNGTPLSAGDLLQNPAYANSLRTLASQGARAFYSGTIAADIVQAVRSAPTPGTLSPADLALYQVKERPPVCAPFRSFQVCGMGPPSSGALSVGQILGLLNSFPVGAPDDPETWRRFGDASRLAFADRGRYIADSDFVPVPTKGLLDPTYLAERAQLLVEGTALETTPPGTPAWDHVGLWADDESIELPSTSHLSIVDAQGNVLSMTTTIENAFGARLMTNGFLLNNELTDFSFRSHRDGRPIANRVAPGKRPRSSMAPTIVLQDGAPVLAIGSPGGSRIIPYVAKTILAWADWGLDIQQAIALPHALNRFGTFDLEADTTAQTLQTPLQDMGYDVSLRDLNSGLHGIEISTTLQGGADPRREGIALGNTN